MNLKKMTICLSLFAAFWALGGCAGAPEVAKQRVFFPFPPDSPRFEYIHSYQSEADFPKSAAQKRKEAIFGKDPVQGLGNPMDVVSDGEGKMYVSDTSAKNVWVYDLVNYRVKKLVDTPLFITPMGLALDGEGNLYVADSENKKVYVFDKDGTPLYNISKNNIPDIGDADWMPIGVSVDNKLGRVYISERRRHLVDAFDKKGGYLFSIGKGLGNVDGAFNVPIDVEVAPDGRIVVVDTMNARVQIFDSEGKFLKKFGRRGSGADSFGFLKGGAIDTEGHLYLTDSDARMIKIFDLDGNFLMTIGGAAYTSKPGKPRVIGGFNLIAGISMDKKNRLYVVDQLNKMVQVFQYLDEAYLKEHPLPEVLPLSPHKSDEPAGFREKTEGVAK